MAKEAIADFAGTEGKNFIMRFMKDLCAEVRDLYSQPGNQMWMRCS